jgi:hypothetical protein
MAGSVMATRALAWGSFLLATVSTVNGQMPGASDVIKNFCKRLEHQCETEAIVFVLWESER